MILAAWLLLVLPVQEKIDEAQIRKAIEQLGADFLDERESARKVLEKAGKPAEPALMKALGSGDYRVRKACVELLTALGSTASLARIADIFRQDEDDSVRDAAFAYLRAQGKNAEDALIGALESEKPAYRHGAVQALTQFKSEKCAEKMAELYDREQDKAIKEDAFRCLQSIGKAAEPFLLKLLGSTDPQVRQGALKGLKQIKTDEVLEAVAKVFVMENDANTLNEAFDYLRDAGPKAEPHFIAGLKSGQEPVRFTSIEGLKLLKTQAGLDPVAALFKTEGSDRVREAAAAFMKSHGLKAEEPFIEALGSSNPKVRLLSIRGLGEIKSEKPLEKIAAIYHERQRDAPLHQAAFEYLRSLGAKAEKHLIRALSEEPDPQLVRAAIDALGQAQSVAAIPKLIEFIGGLDADKKSAARDALVRIGGPALKAVEAAVNEAKAKHGPEHAEVRRLERAAGDILALFYQEEVERLLSALVTDEGGTGFYDGMFQELHRFGREKAKPVLVKVLGDPNFPWRLSPRKMNESDYRLKMRELAVMALGELGDESVLEPLKAALADAGPGRSDDIREELVIAIFRRGDPKPFDEYARRLTAEAEAGLKGDLKTEACGALFSLGLIQNRVGRRADAEATYLRVVRAVEEHKLPPREINVYPTTLYNIACLAALRGDKAKAVEWLRKAVEAGFRDRAWIRMDRDLEGLRGDAGFRALLADDQLFEKRPDD